ncbi:STAS domain-containing protein [Geotalea sp. SG265]|uniref:STAS domain-containing protein n=1 Tax=Geotalea sp. SG265 TaxID=2922867 RepID=UPI001FAF416D|nr:STAS domain-containing protein [Geotalea sp. SG265]
MDSSFKIVHQTRPLCNYFAMAGNIDAQAEAQLMGLPAKVNQQLVKFDFSDTGRINSMGIALLLRCFKRIKEEKKAEIQVMQVNPTNTMLFRMTGIFLLAAATKE